MNTIIYCFLKSEYISSFRVFFSPSTPYNSFSFLWMVYVTFHPEKRLKVTHSHAPFNQYGFLMQENHQKFYLPLFSQSCSPFCFLPLLLFTFSSASLFTVICLYLLLVCVLFVWLCACVRVRVCAVITPTHHPTSQQQTTLSSYELCRRPRTSLKLHQKSIRIVRTSTLLPISFLSLICLQAVTTINLCIITSSCEDSFVFQILISWALDICFGSAGCFFFLPKNPPSDLFH